MGRPGTVEAISTQPGIRRRKRRLRCHQITGSAAGIKNIAVAFTRQQERRPGHNRSVPITCLDTVSIAIHDSDHTTGNHHASGYASRGPSRHQQRYGAGRS